MLRFLADEDVWNELRSTSRKRKFPLHVAVPYLGKNAGDLIRFKQGDTLVVALTESNSRNGSVCPSEIGRLQKKGVKVSLAPDLHAKVMLCGRRAIVGSANLSSTSNGRRDEAALLTTDTSILKEIREWFKARESEAVTPEWLRICEKVYRPPRGVGRGRSRTRRTTRKQMGRAVWLVGLVPLDDAPESERAAVEKGEAEAERDLTDAKSYEVRWMRLSDNQPFVGRMKRGDTVVEITRDGREHYVEEHGRVLRFRRMKTKRGTTVTYVYVEYPRRPKTLTWGEFKAVCSKVGLKLGRNVVGRELTNPAQAAKVLSALSKRR